jgi:glycosyltransferase involved in cell wall biosynthesis
MLNNTIVVSVIIATRNDCSRVGLAISSILQQTFQDFEIIVVNDASTDDTEYVLKKYTEFDSRIKVLNERINLGRARARNAAIKIANGEFIAILDSDDFMLPKRLEIQVEYIKSHPQVGILGSGAIFDVDGVLLLAQPPGGNFILRNRLISGQNNSLINSSLFARKDTFTAYGGYIYSKHSKVYNEDYITFAELVKITQIDNIQDPLIVVSTNGLINAYIMKRKLIEMNNFEYLNILRNFSFKRLARIFIRQIIVITPNFLVSLIYEKRLKSLPKYNNFLNINELKSNIELLKNKIEKN